MPEAGSLAAKHNLPKNDTSGYMMEWCCVQSAV
jgi:hypothetical protein